ASTGPGDSSDGRNARALQGVEDAIHARLIVQGVLGPGKRLELGNVRSCREGLFSRACEDQRSMRGILLRLVKDFTQALVHAEGERISGLGAIEGEATHAILDFIEKLLAHCVAPF